MADTTAPVSNSPLVPVIKHDEEIRAWLGAIAMWVFAYVLWRILTGKDSIAGETEFQGLKYAWLLFVWPAVHGFFRYQDWVSMTRPTGGQKGFWYGLLGALLAVSAVEMLLGWIEEPVTTLSSLYQSQFTLHSMSLDLFFQVLGFSSLLGIIGAWIEVSLHLYRARPK